MEPQENSNVMQSSVPVSLEPKVEPVVPEKPVVEKKPSKMNVMIIGMVLLIVCLVLGLTYYVLKDNGTDLLALGKQTDTNTESSTDDSSTTEEQDSDTTVCEDTGTTTGSCKVSVDNKGWSLFSVPEYNFSVEVPSYTITQKLESENIQSRWTAWFNNDPSNKDGYSWEYLLENNIGTVDLTFYPIRIPEGLGCGFGCVGEHVIYINIYENKGSQNLADAVSAYRTAWEGKYVDEDILSGNLKGENVKKWGMDVWSFDAALIGGTWHGYLVVTDNYIYDVEYMLSGSSTESTNIALKVLDSMKFGE